MRGRAAIWDARRVTQEVHEQRLWLRTVQVQRRLLEREEAAERRLLLGPLWRQSVHAHTATDNEAAADSLSDSEPVSIARGERVERWLIAHEEISSWTKLAESLESTWQFIQHQALEQRRHMEVASSRIQRWWIRILRGRTAHTLRQCEAERIMMLRQEGLRRRTVLREEEAERRDLRSTFSALRPPTHRSLPAPLESKLLRSQKERDSLTLLLAAAPISTRPPQAADAEAAWTAERWRFEKRSAMPSADTHLEHRAIRSLTERQLQQRTATA